MHTTMRVELRAGEPFVRLRVVVDNPCRDHRVRLHVPLAGPAERSSAEGQFAVVERGTSAEGGHGEVPLPTFPASGFVDAGGVAVLLDHVTEYELLTDPPELALTLLRSVGQISRDHHRYREEPAGPQTPTPGAQCLGERVADLAVYPHPGAWHTDRVLAFMECFRHDLLAAPGPAGGRHDRGGRRARGRRRRGAVVAAAAGRLAGAAAGLPASRPGDRDRPRRAGRGPGGRPARPARAGPAGRRRRPPARPASLGDPHRPAPEGGTMTQPAGGTGFPLPGTGRATVAVPAPGPGEGRWVGAPSAAVDPDGGFVVAYRVRVVDQRGAATVVARSPDGERLTTVATLDKGGSAPCRWSGPRSSGPRRAAGGCTSAAPPRGASTGGSTCWSPTTRRGWPTPRRHRVSGDDLVGVKDPVIRVDGRWHAWVCCHPLDEPDEEDRMTTAYATSGDGLAWEWRGTALAPRPGTWDARGARVTAVLGDGRAFYDGRATKEENFSERTGLARRSGPDGRLVAEGGGPVADVRYLEVVPLPGGGHRLWYEAPLPDGSHELRTELVG